MPLASHVLFPVDFSLSSTALIPAVAAVARRLNVPVTLLHSVQSVDTPSAATLSEREARLAAFGKEGFAGLEIQREIASGAPAATIVARAQELGGPLIMLPTKGTSAFRQLLIGSVTASVLHDADCPVWTTAHCEDGGPLPEAYRSIVCAVDLGPLSVPVLAAASEFAAVFGAELHVVHSVPGIDPRFESGAANRAHAFLVNTAKEEYPALAAAAHVDQPLEIAEETTVTAGITAAAARHHADLLVIGRGVMQGVLGRLRTNAHDLIRQSPCPVLSV